MVCIVYFDVLVITRLLNMIDACARSLNCLTTQSVASDIGNFHWLKLVYMAILMAEDKSRYNDMNTILYEMDASKP